MDDDGPVTLAEAWYSQADDAIRVDVREGDRTVSVPIDIRDAVYLRYMLDGAIGDYEKAVGR